MRARLVLPVVGVATALAAWSPPAGQGMTVAGCGPRQIAGSFVHLAGSDGAGQTSYAVRLRNTGRTPCTVSGLPTLRLLSARGRPLPTRVVPAQPGAGTAILVTLAPRATAIATGRFDRSVPASGEPVDRPCEPTAHRIRISIPSPGHGTVTGPVRPPTTVCDHGRITLGLLHRRS